MITAHVFSRRACAKVELELQLVDHMCRAAAALPAAHLPGRCACRRPCEAKPVHAVDEFVDFGISHELGPLHNHALRCPETVAATRPLLAIAAAQSAHFASQSASEMPWRCRCCQDLVFTCAWRDVKCAATSSAEMPISAEQPHKTHSCFELMRSTATPSIPYRASIGSRPRARPGAPQLRAWAAPAC